ncbi:MAG: hypothetical protein HQM10_10585 [Candidatus Riflebacteria bacterium]|nr:hypothetical protein [Candidatus Riflebacteria bacterium]
MRQNTANRNKGYNMIRMPADCIRRSTSGLTFVELIFAIVCSMILLPAIYSALSSGTRSSLRGMAQVNTTLETKAILKQVCDDLYNSCIEYGSSPVNLDLGATLLKDSATPPYTFLVFPHHGNLYDSFVSPKSGGQPRILKSPVQAGGVSQSDQTGLSERLLSEVTYDLQPVGSGNSFLKKLVRKEKYHSLYPLAADFPAGTKVEVLSDRVQSFNIRRETHFTIPNSNKGKIIFYFRISIQLVDFPPGTNISTTAINPMNIPNGVVVSDYFDVVCPKFFNERFNNGYFNSNWNSGAVGSPEKAGL